MSAEPASDKELAGAHDGLVRSHRWASSHTALAAQLHDADNVRQIDETLRGAVTVDIGTVRADERRYVLPEDSRVRGGERLVFDVLLENERVGHRFPGGVRDLQDTWVEVVVRDASGRVLGVSRPSAESHENVFVLRATMLDAEANPDLIHRVHRFTAPAFDRTLGAHDARAIRYSIVLPLNIALPLRVDARLMHRKHSPEVQAFACEASRTERGLAFAEGAERHGKIALDPCAAQPVTTVGAATVWMGRGATARPRKGGAARPAVERLLTQGLALLHANQERVHLAKPSIVRAQELARESASLHLQARAFVLRARLAAMQGRPERAVAFTKRAESLNGPSPVFDRVRGDAYARAWRWTLAAEAYQRVVDAAPLDYRAWRDLARAYGSLSDDRNALGAAEAGLRLAPRDESLLRSRALALEALNDPEAERAKRRWLAHRNPDGQPALLATCEQTHDRCRRDRQPIPHYTLAPPTKAIHASIDPG